MACCKSLPRGESSPPPPPRVRSAIAGFFQRRLRKLTEVGGLIVRRTDGDGHEMLQPQRIAEHAHLHRRRNPVGRQTIDFARSRVERRDPAAAVHVKQRDVDRKRVRIPQTDAHVVAVIEPNPPPIDRQRHALGSRLLFSKRNSTATLTAAPRAVSSGSEARRSRLRALAIRCKRSFSQSPRRSPRGAGPNSGGSASAFPLMAMPDAGTR